jgi:hypothetical protein
VAVREFVLERDGHACRFCAIVTNVVGRLDFSGDEFHPENLAAQCRRCLGIRALAAQPKRGYPGPDEISRPNDGASPKQRRLLRQLGCQAEGITRAEATRLIAELLEADKATP